MFDLFKYNLRKIKANSWKSKGKTAVYEKQTSIKGDYQDFLTLDYISELTKRVKENSSILDLGCGTGVLSLRLGELNYKVSALDISQEMLNQLKLKANNLAIDTYQGDVFDMSFPDNTFDGIITRWVVPHFPDWTLIIKEAVRVLKKDGYFIFDMTSKDNYSLATSHAEVDFSKFGYNPDDKESKSYYASATREELTVVLEGLNLDVIDIIPNGFYRSNAVFSSSLGSDEYQNMQEQYQEFYKNDDVKSFIQWFDLMVTKKLPTSLSNTLTVIVQKK